MRADTAAAWSGPPRLRQVTGRPPQPADADGPVASWPTNGGPDLHAFRVRGTAWLTLPGLAAFRLEEEEVALVPDGGSAKAIDDAWVRSVLPLALQERGTQVLHASALAGEAGIVALCGVATAGKSTLAAALAAGRHGLTVVADDALAFTVPPTGPVLAHPLPFRLRLRPASRQALKLPEIALRTDEPTPSAPLTAIVLLDPHGDDDPPTLEPVEPAAALGALMPHAYCFALEEGKAALVEAYGELAARVRMLRLTYPQRIERLDETTALLGDRVC